MILFRVCSECEAHNPPFSNHSRAGLPVLLRKKCVRSFFDALFKKTRILGVPCRAPRRARIYTAALFVLVTLPKIGSAITYVLAQQTRATANTDRVQQSWCVTAKVFLHIPGAGDARTTPMALNAQERVNDGRASVVIVNVQK